MNIETVSHLTKKLRSEAFESNADPVVMLDAADAIEELSEQLHQIHHSCETLEGIISNLRAKLHHLQMVDSGE